MLFGFINWCKSPNLDGVSFYICKEVKVLTTYTIRIYENHPTYLKENANNVH